MLYVAPKGYERNQREYNQKSTSAKFFIGFYYFHYYCPLLFYLSLLSSIIDFSILKYLLRALVLFIDAISLLILALVEEIP